MEVSTLLGDGPGTTVELVVGLQAEQVVVVGFGLLGFGTATGALVLRIPSKGFLVSCTMATSLGETTVLDSQLRGGVRRGGGLRGFIRKRTFQVSTCLPECKVLSSKLVRKEVSG